MPSFYRAALVAQRLKHQNAVMEARYRGYSTAAELSDALVRCAESMGG